MSDYVGFELCESENMGYCRFCGRKLENGLVFGVLDGWIEEPEDDFDEYADNFDEDVEYFDEDDDDHRVVTFYNSYATTVCVDCHIEIEKLIELAMQFNTADGGIHKGLTVIIK